MRRWFEFGWDENFAAPKFVLNSNRKKSGPRPQGEGDLPAVFISMPFKDDLLEILQGCSLSGVEPFSFFLAQIRNGGSTDGPASDCTAEHVVNGANANGWRVVSFYTGGIWQHLIGGFPKSGGGFTPPILAMNAEPPSENG